MVFKPGADNLLAVVEVFGPDEADDGVYKKRAELAGDGVGASLACLHVDVPVSLCGKSRPLSRLEVHHVVADSAPAEGERGFVRLADNRKVYAEILLAISVPAIDWKTKSTGAPRSIAVIAFVMCESTQDCVGIA